MFYIIYDANNGMLILAVFGSALTEQAERSFQGCKDKAIGTNSNIKMTQSSEKWSVGEKFVLDTGK